jgi:Translation initiation factor IF-2, N-terminal region.
MAKRRIFHIAKELNISHTEILSFLEGKGIEVASHMAPIEEDVYKLVLSEFHKDKESVERYRKEQVRREIHDTRILEQQKANKKLNLLTLEKQRELEEKEKKKEKEDIKAKEEQIRRETIKKEQSQKEKLRTEELEIENKKTKEIELKKKELDKKKQLKSGKKTFRKVELSDIESQVGKGTTNRPSKAKPVDSKKLKSTTATVKKIKASLETKSKKKVYKKDKISDSDDESLKDAKPLSIAEFSNVDELSKMFEVPSNSIIQKCMGLGV